MGLLPCEFLAASVPLLGVVEEPEERTQGGPRLALPPPTTGGGPSPCPSCLRYSTLEKSLDHRCSCCKEERTSEREVVLDCPDGSSLTHTYTHIESCLCQDTACVLPQAQQSRVRRSSLRLLGRK